MIFQFLAISLILFEELIVIWKFFTVYYLETFK